MLGRARPDLVSDIAANLRSFPTTSYVLYYRPMTDSIELVRVLHSARDVAKALSGEDEE